MFSGFSRFSHFSLVVRPAWKGRANIMAGFSVNDLLAGQVMLLESLNHVEDEDARTDIWRNYFSGIDLACSIADFGEDLQWINTNRALSMLQDLSKKIVILDFFTYCCINCMHLLPDLEALEQVYSVEDGVVVIGVHSAKFENEKVLANVKSAVLRYNIHHPVVNDPQGNLWEHFGIFCWPTVLVLVPRLKPTFVFLGEGNREKLIQFVGAALNFYEQTDQISHDSLPMHLLTENIPNSILRFPGKVSCDPTGKRIAVSDTGHNRVLIVSVEGVVQCTVGCGKSGFNDGRFENTSFSSPQGTAWLNSDIVFVADTENHAIREIDLRNKFVKTVAGTGKIGVDTTGGLVGTLQPISSPWDVCVVHFDVPVLFIAMAGTHQIWVLTLQDSSSMFGRVFDAKICAAVAGSGKEENRNNRFPLKAAFSQPSGLSWASLDSDLYVADSESSAVRVLSLKEGQVKNVVGGELDPNDLFAYGDADGHGTSAKLQHPLGIAWGDSRRQLYIVDSYNHKIKVIDIKPRNCVTLCGSGKPGDNCGNFGVAEFNEPGGICVHPDGKHLFVVDTNNHKLKRLNLDSGIVDELIIVDAEDIVDLPDGIQINRPSINKISVSREDVHLLPNGKLQLNLQLEFEQSFKLNAEAPNSWKIDITNGIVLCSKNSGIIESLNTELCLASVLESDVALQESLIVECRIYYCDVKGLCLFKTILFPIMIHISAEGNSICEILLKYKIVA